MECIFIVMRGEFIESDHLLTQELDHDHRDEHFHKKKHRKENDIIGIHHILEQLGESTATNAYTLSAPLSGCIAISVKDIRAHVDTLPHDLKR